MKAIKDQIIALEHDMERLDKLHVNREFCLAQHSAVQQHITDVMQPVIERLNNRELYKSVVILTDKVVELIETKLK